MNNGLEQSIHRIISGKLLFYHNNCLYTLLYPNISLKYKADLIYENILNDEKYNTWIRSDQLEQYMINLEIWTNEMSIFITKADRQIEDLKISLYNNRLNSKMTSRTRSQLNHIRRQVSELQQKKQTFYNQTLEGYAYSIKYEYLIINTLFHNKKRVFGKFGSLQNSHQDFTGIVSEINQYNLSTADYRSISRSDLWRSYWSIDKNNIFDGPVSRWTEEQRTLAGYSAMYDSIYEHPEKPPDAVIEEDDMLDGWMISQRRNIEKAKQQESMTKTSSKLGKAQEVFIFTDSQEGVSEIMNMNTSEANLAIAQRANAINNNNIIEHSRLPDVQKQLLNK